jgi:hypothetical protein
MVVAMPMNGEGDTMGIEGYLEGVPGSMPVAGP